MMTSAWCEVARQFGLRLELGYPVRWSGVVGEVSLALDIASGRPGAVAPGVTLACPARPDLVVLPADRAFTPSEAIRTGDPAFDGDVFVADSDPTILGLFDAETRNLVRALAVRGVIVAGGAIRMDPESAARLKAREVVPHVVGMVQLARVLARDDDARLDGVARIMHNDPLPAVRGHVARVFGEHSHFQALRVELDLKRLRSESAGTLEALTAHLHDDTLAPDVRGEVLDRLLTAFPLHELHGVLVGLPASLGPRAVVGLIAAMKRVPATNPEGPAAGMRLLLEAGIVPAGLTEAQAMGLADLLGEAGDHAALPVLAMLCDDLRPPVHREAFKSLMRIRIPGPSAYAALSPRAQRHGHVCVPELVTANPELGGALLAELYANLNPSHVMERVRYLKALGATGEAAWTPFFVEVLGSPFQEVESAAFVALGEIAELSMVGVLKPYTEGFLRSGTSKAFAREAIARIQERHGVGADMSGALALTDGDPSGQLALADADDPKPPEGA
jgi:hypothetical protein